MQIPEGAKTFVTAPDMYDKFMGRFSSPLAVEFVKSLPLQKGQTALDIGCGPGALTGASRAMMLRRSGISDGTLPAIPGGMPCPESGGEWQAGASGKHTV